MLLKNVLSGLWSGDIRPVQGVDRHFIVNLIRKALPVDVYFLESQRLVKQPLVLSDTAEIEQGLSIGDAIAEETGDILPHGTIVIIAPVGALCLSQKMKSSHMMGQIASEIMLRIIAEGMIPISEENTAIYSMALICQRAANTPLAIANGLNPEAFVTGMGLGLSEYWSGEIPTAFGVQTADTKDAFRTYMRKLNKNFDVRDHLDYSLSLGGSSGNKIFSSGPAK